MSSPLPRRSPTALLQRLEAGAVLFCTRTEVYFGLNDVGIRIWSALPEPDATDPGSFDAVVDGLSEAYPGVERELLAADAAEFLAALDAHELVTRDAAAPPSA